MPQDILTGEKDAVCGLLLFPSPLTGEAAALFLSLVSDNRLFQVGLLSTADLRVELEPDT